MKTARTVITHLSAIMVLFAPCTTASTLLVNPEGTGTHPTIQAAIDSAAEGDTVLLASGTFRGEGNRDLDFLGKAITVRSESGDPDDCVLDCEGSYPNPHRGFHFHSSEGPTSHVEGITIRWGFAQHGGGIHCTGGASPTISNCCLRDNSGSYQAYGAGVYCFQSSPTIEDCEFLGNLGEFGGGVLCKASPATIRRCTFEANQGSQRGGAIACWDLSDAVISDCVFTDNLALCGGAIHCSDSSPTITSCEFLRNDSSYGGALCCTEQASPLLTDCVFSENTSAIGGACAFYDQSQATLEHCDFLDNLATPAASALGGAIYAIHASPRFHLCNLIGNRSGRGGGATYFVGADAAFDSCTFQDNSAEWGGAISCTSDSQVSPILRHCTLYENGATLGGGGIDVWNQVCPVLENTIIAFCTEGEAVLLEEGASATLTCCDLYGNAGGDWTTGIEDQYGIDGNISENPHFCIYGNPEDPLTLRIDSPCAAENNPECGQIGARPIGCDMQDVTGESETIRTRDVLWSSINPVVSATRIHYRLPPSAQPTSVHLSIYDLAGHLVRTLVDKVMPAGEHCVIWDGRSEAGHAVPTGCFFLRLQTGDMLFSIRLVVIQ